MTSDRTAATRKEPTERSVQLPSPAHPWLRAAFALVPVTAALLVHGVSLGHGFIGDDNLLVLANEQITREGSWRDILTSDWFSRTDGGAIGYYRPISKLTLYLTYRLAGPSSVAFHLGNVAMHALAVLSLFALGRRLFEAPTAALAATVFAVTPSTAQAVSIVTARPDVLGAMLAFVTCAAFLAWRDTRSRGWLAAALVVWLFALGSKESVLLLSVALFPLAIARGETPRSAIRASSPFLAMSAGVVALRMSIGIAPLPNSLAHLSWGKILLAVLKAVGSYLAPLTLGRPILALPHLPNGPADPMVLLGALLVASGVALLVHWRRTPVGFALTLGALFLGPALAIWLLHIPRWPDAIPIAERWLYGPSAAIALLIAASLSRLRAPLRHVLGGALVLVLAIVAFQRVQTFKDPATYSAFAVEQFREEGEANLFPNERYLLRYHEGLALSDAKRYDEAVAALQEATAIAPWLGESWEVLAKTESKQGHHAQAEAVAGKLLSSQFWADPRGRKERARFGSDAEIRIDRASLHDIVGRALAARKEWEPALAEFERAGELGQGSLAEQQYFFDQGVALEALGRLDKARSAFEKAQRLEPQWFGPALRLALLDRKEGRPEAAKRRIEEVIAKGGEGAEAALKLQR